jgi:hypothetical protein
MALIVENAKKSGWKSSEKGNWHIDAGALKRE